jgi:SAM-dependent methyltransferase
MPVPTPAPPSRAANDLYLTGEGAALYDLMTTVDRSEISEVLRALRSVSGPVLELACGSGRLTLPILRRAHDVTAVDNSAAMLRILRARAAAVAISGRLELRQDDMTRLRLGRRFEAIVIGATSVSLLDRADRGALLERIREHLAPGGRLLASALELAREDCASVQPWRRQVEIELGGKQVSCTVVEELDAVNDRRTVTVTVRDPVTYETRAYVTRPYVVEPAMLAAEIEAHGLRVRAAHRIHAQLGPRSAILLEAEAGR